MRRRAADEKGTLRMVVTLNDTMTSISMKLRLSHAQWKRGKVTGIPNADKINAELMRKKAEFDGALLQLVISGEADNMTATQAKDAILGGKSAGMKDKKAITSIFNEYISDTMRPATKELYDITLRKVLAFSGGDISIDKIDIRWLRGFETSLARTLTVNARAAYLRTLRTICGYAVKAGITNRYAFSGFHITHEQTAKRSIPIGDMRRLLHFHGSPSQEKYRDIFLLMFYLIGINSADLFTAKPSQVVGGRLEYERAKTGRRYSIKIEPEAAELIGKYHGEKYLLFVKDRWKSEKGFLHKMNDALGTLGERTVEELPTDDLFAQPIFRTVSHPIVPGLTSYYARHSWATYAYDIGISTDIIAQALGHANGNRTTMIYIRPDRRKVDEANRAVIDYLLER